MSTKQTAPAGPGPLDRAPRRIRPPFNGDYLLDPPHPGETIDQWRDRRHTDATQALLEPLAGIELGDYDRKILDWLANWDTDTIGTLASLLYRARAAGPIGGGR